MSSETIVKEALKRKEAVLMQGVGGGGRGGGGGGSVRARQVRWATAWPCSIYSIGDATRRTLKENGGMVRL